MKTMILDVDDVLFNTPALKEEIERIANERSVEVESLRTPEVLSEIIKKQPDFFKSCLYPRAASFISRAQENGWRCVLLSSAQSSGSDDVATKEQLEFQRMKIYESGLAQLVGGEENIRIVPSGKDEALGEFAGSENVFIDNEKRHLRATREYGIRPIHMVREHMQHSIRPESIEHAAEHILTVPDLESLMEYFEREGMVTREHTSET